MRRTRLAVVVATLGAAASGCGGASVVAGGDSDAVDALRHRTGGKVVRTTCVNRGDSSACTVFLHSGGATDCELWSATVQAGRITLTRVVHHITCRPKH